MKYQGLNNQELAHNYQKYGKNKIERGKNKTFFDKTVEVLKEPVFLLLVVCSLVYFLVGEIIDGSIMLIAVSAIIGIELYQQGKTDKTLEKLKDLSNPTSKVVRNGKIITINSEDLTVGDIIVVNEGDKINADAIILEAHELRIDESSLTGESMHVVKSDIIDADNYFKTNYLYAGTLVIGGNGYAKVTSVGVNTEAGKITSEVLNAPKIVTPLQRQINTLVTIFATIAFSAFTILVIISYMHTQNIIESFLSGVTLALGLIPEEFPVIFTVFLTMGAYRLALNNALVRRLSSVEALGSINILFSDKTGTITLNKMKVMHIIAADREKLIKSAILASDANTFDPLEKAILDLTDKNFDQYKCVRKYPFSSEHKIMGNLCTKDKQHQLFVKGAVEVILKNTKLTPLEQDKILEEASAMTLMGLRVIAVASASVDRINDDIFDYKLEYVGLLGLEDPPRRGIKEAIKTCHLAGIHVVMITGDNGQTALSIAKQIGLQNTEECLLGQEIDQLNDDELYQRLKTTSVIARVIPAHKSRIVNLCRCHNDVVAMTGDGVNDAPALKNASIGISMGKRGTEVAKEASALILTDDNFNTIVHTIKDARKIYDNIKKASVYIMIVHIPLIGFSLLLPVFDLPLLLVPILIVIFELIIDPICSVVFERIPASAQIMNRPPRNPNESLIKLTDVFKVLILGTTILAVAMFPYILISPYDLALAKSMALVIIFVANLTLSYLLASNEKSSLRVLFTMLRDKVIIFINLVVVSLITVMLYVPLVSDYMGTKALSKTELITAVSLGIGSVIWYDILKLTKVIVGYVFKKNR